MLLNCGHDLCRGCLKLAYKKGNQVICVVCSADCEYEIFLSFMLCKIIGFLIIFIYFLIFKMYF